MNSRKRGGDAGDDAVPIAERSLPEQARGRIPGAGFAIERPAPIGRERDQHPERPPHGAGEMRRPRCRRRSRDRHSAITAAVSVKFSSSPPTWVTRFSLGELLRILAAHVALNADEARRHWRTSGASCANGIERLRSLKWLALPDQAMAIRGRGSAPMRADHLAKRRLVGREIRNFRRHRVEARSATPAAGCRAGNARRRAAAPRRAR